MAAARDALLGDVHGGCACALFVDGFDVEVCVAAVVEGEDLADIGGWGLVGDLFVAQEHHGVAASFVGVGADGDGARILESLEDQDKMLGARRG